VRRWKWYCGCRCSLAAGHVSAGPSQGEFTSLAWGSGLVCVRWHARGGETARCRGSRSGGARRDGAEETLVTCWKDSGSHEPEDPRVVWLDEPGCASPPTWVSNTDHRLLMKAHEKTP
jgi:hypothetical protein